MKTDLIPYGADVPANGRDTELGPYAPRPHAPRISILRAARRHWVLVALPIVVFVALAAGIGLSREPTYTGAARLNIGRIDVSAPGALSGFSAATQALASSYSRAIDAEA